MVEDIRCSCAMRAGPRCQSSPTCASTGINTSRSSSSGGRTDASRLICWSMAVASYFCSAAVSAAVSSGVRRAGATAGRRARAGCGGEMAQFRIGEPGEAADAVSVFHRAAQQSQARDVGVRVHPAAVVTDRA